MAFVEIPTRNDLPAYNYVVRLDGVNYKLSYYFNPRMNNGQGKWFVGLYDQLDNLLVAAVPIVATWPLFDRFKSLGIPPGTIFCFDTSGQNKDPGQFDLGDRCRMIYMEADT